VAVAGGGILLLGVAAYAGDQQFHAPRWVVASIGVMLLLASVLVYRGGATDARQADPVASLIGAGLLSAFALVMGWLLLFTSPDEWSMSGPIPLPRVVQAGIFYLLLGGMTLLVTGAAVATWRLALRGLGTYLPAPLGAGLPWAGLLVALALAGALGYRLFGPPAGPPEPAVALSFEGTMDDGGPARALPGPNGDELTYLPGVRGQALFFGGSDDWVDYALPATLALDGSLSLELWFRREDWVNPHRAGSGLQSLAVAGPLSLALDVSRGPGDGPRRFRLVGRAGSARVIDRDGSVPPGTWTHVAVVYDAAWFAVRLYADGRQVARRTVPMAPDVPPRPTLRLATWYRSNQAFRGAIDEVRLYERALTAGEIRAHATLPR
jgi:hypothetical protein